MENVFAQENYSYVIEFNVKFKHLAYFTDNLEDSCDSISLFEAEETSKFESQPEDLWCIKLYYEGMGDFGSIDTKVAILSTSLGIEKPLVSAYQLDDEDWVEKVQSNFKPINAGRFFVYNAFYKGDIPKDKIPLHIDIGRAFGTGEHETTKSCLKLITNISKNRQFKNMLDMGCGSAILAIAMSKLWRGKILAVDIDETSVKVSKNNIKLNKENDQIKAYVSDGYKSHIVKNSGKYDIIVANILAKPLVKFAKDLCNNLEPGGIAILSGFLDYQKQMVLNSHQIHGLKLIDEIKDGRWVSITLEK